MVVILEGDNLFEVYEDLTEAKLNKESGVATLVTRTWIGDTSTEITNTVKGVKRMQCKSNDGAFFLGTSEEPTK